MKWTPGGKSRNIEDLRGQPGASGRGTGRGTLGGVGVGAVLLALVAKFVFGVDITASGEDSGTDPSAGLSSGGPGATYRPAPGEDELVEFVSFVLDDVQDIFAQKFKEQGKRYEFAKLVLFSRKVDSGCGYASADMGPFYCPPDKKAYIDLSFYQDLKSQYGAPGDFAQAYVIAHEIGHHLQNILGIDANVDRQMRANQGRKNDLSVRQELQADCFAGVWGHSTQQRAILDKGDIEEGLGAASAVGDDRLQRQAGARVNPETWTHGSSAQRVRWFKKGFESGSLDACDTFSAQTL